jgi:hypothetical protein
MKTNNAKFSGREPAFSSIEINRYREDCPFEAKTEPGLSKREYFAGLALQGLLANQNIGNCPKKIANVAIMAADALLDELNKEK